MIKRITEDSGRSLYRLHISENFKPVANAAGDRRAQDSSSAAMLRSESRSELFMDQRSEGGSALLVLKVRGTLQFFHSCDDSLLSVA